MKTKICVIIIAVLLTTLISFPVLFSGVIFTQSKEFEGSIWSNSEAAIFEFDFSETKSVNMGVFFRINNNFNQFSNLILFSKLINKDIKDTIYDTLNIKVYDSWGNCLGSGTSAIKTFEYNYKEDYTLNKGAYCLEILQGMRADSLHGIKDFGFKITK